MVDISPIVITVITMKSVEVKLARIGNSLGIRLNRDLLNKYGIRESLLLESREDRIVLRPLKKDAKLSWKQTFADMKAEKENWSEWEEITADGLENL